MSWYPARIVYSCRGPEPALEVRAQHDERASASLRRQHAIAHQLAEELTPEAVAAFQAAQAQRVAVLLDLGDGASSSHGPILAASAAGFPGRVRP